MEKENIKELGIYIHIPFCRQKCKYCDFLSFSNKEELQSSYVEKLKREIELWGKSYGKQGRNDYVPTIYFGGGTPSLLPAFFIEDILVTLRENFSVAEDCEITLECNPGTVDKEKILSYYNMGINRISFGLQSADDGELKTIGRIHTYDIFCQNYEAARKAGFENINVDIMSALPGQTIESYHDTLKKVIALRPEHISSYSLMIEEGTPFYDLWNQGKLNLPDEDTERQMYYDTNEYLENAGYARYEISNYARQGYESKHNTSYWIRKNYLGLGLGASSMIDNVRFKNTEKMDVYLKEKEEIMHDEDREELTIIQQMEEYMFLGLRLMKGISVEEFERQFQKSFTGIYGEICDQLQQQGLLLWEEGKVKLTSRGIDVSNAVLAEFLLTDI
ncbi:MAG: radical SAM family heme chaperone HemW [Lachnospiraceae bacterium]|nr:radical SAM family heme chaperone HemW [Lachnospiraceae bacterium]